MSKTELRLVALVIVVLTAAVITIMVQRGLLLMLIPMVGPGVFIYFFCAYVVIKAAME